MMMQVKAKLDVYDAESLILIVADMAERLVQLADSRPHRAPLELRLELTDFQLDEPRI